MQKLIFPIILIFSVLVYTPSNGKNSKAINAINTLLKTNTLLTLDSLKSEMKERAKRIKEEISAGKIKKSSQDELSTRFDKSVANFNNIIIHFQNDLLDRNTRRLMINSPEIYEKAISNDIANAKTFYETEFLAYYNGITGKNAFPILAGVALIIDLYKMYKNFNRELKQITLEIVEENFTKKVLFPKWDNI